MGYDVHITRKQQWFDEEPVITPAEWAEYVRTDPTMRMDGFAEASNPAGETLRYENAGLAVWTGWSRDGQDGSMAWFDFQNGNIVVKSPDPEILQKMWVIAEALGAKVQGDEGETYGQGGEMLS